MVPAVPISSTRSSSEETLLSRLNANGSQESRGVRLCLIGMLSCASIFGNTDVQRASFPEKHSELRSPDGNYVIRNSDNDQEEPAHTLTLIEVRSGSVKTTYKYGRGVDVLWSPTSKAFVVNDHEGSDSERPILFSAPWTNEYTDLREKLTDFLRSRGKASLLDNHHIYFSVQRWLGSDELLCKVTGYGDANPKGFAVTYVYKIGVGFRSRTVNLGKWSHLVATLSAHGIIRHPNHLTA